MSMLTAQANHLREMAYTVERVKNDAIGKLSLSGSIALATAAMDMRDAADTIAQLRNTCNDLQAENEKLRDAIQVMYDFLLSGKVDQCDLCDMAGTCENHPAPPPCKYDRMEESLMDWLHEQGIEVDES